MRLKPIATVINTASEDVQDWSEVESRLVFEKEYIPGLYKLGKFKHIWVIFGFHKKRGWSPRVHPMHDPERPLVGVFATRSPKRPNKLGLTLVELVSVHGNTVRVRGLDAYNGSPVWDIKPYEEEIVYDSQDPRKSR